MKRKATSKMINQCVGIIMCYRMSHSPRPSRTVYGCINMKQMRSLTSLTPCVGPVLGLSQLKHSSSHLQGVQENFCFFHNPVEPVPRLSIAARDIRSNWSVQSLLLAGHFFVQPIAALKKKHFSGYPRAYVGYFNLY